MVPHRVLDGCPPGDVNTGGNFTTLGPEWSDGAPGIGIVVRLKIDSLAP